MVDYFAVQPEKTIAPDNAQRAVGVDLVSIVGDQATVKLSSLDFSTTEPKAGTVTVSLDGVELDRGNRGPGVPDPVDLRRDRPGDGDLHHPRGCHCGVGFTITTPTGTTSSFTLPL